MSCFYCRALWKMTVFQSYLSNDMLIAGLETFLDVTYSTFNGR